MSHSYIRDSLSGLPICADCGAAMHRDGRFWLWGKFSAIEPPCVDDETGQRAWYWGAKLDPKDPFTSDQRERWVQPVTEREGGEGQIQTLTHHSHQPPGRTD